MFLINKVTFSLGMVLCCSEIVVFGQKGDSLGQKKYFLAEKVSFLSKNVFLRLITTSDAIVLKMI